MEQFRIEVADGNKGRFFDIKPLENAMYEIYEQEAYLGTLVLDKKNHSHCDGQGCELDMPVMQSIRESIQYYENWKGTHD